METAFHRFRARFMLAILAGDVRTSRAVVDAALGEGADEDAVVIGVIRPALYEVGVRWASREIGVAEEHVASATAAIALEHLAERDAPEPVDEPIAIVSCAEGELHTLGARAIADALERHGWRTLYCGASTPVQELVALAHDRGARLVALSAALRARLEDAQRAATELRALDPAPVVLVGGQACHHPQDCPGADIVHIGADFRKLVRSLRRELGCRGAAG